MDGTSVFRLAAPYQHCFLISCSIWFVILYIVWWSFNNNNNIKSYKVIYGLSIGISIIDLRCPLKDNGHGQTLKLTCQISQKRYEIEKSVNRS